MIRFFALIVFVCIVLSSNGQLAFDSIFLNLEQGALLVRLQTKSKTIESVKVGNPTLAKQISETQQTENFSIMNAFANNFTLCPVYFFYAEESRQIKQANFQGILFDSNFDSVKNTILENNYLIAEFDQARGNTMEHEAKINTYDDKGELTGTRDTVIVYHTGYAIDALVLLDPRLTPIPQGYPRYVRQKLVLQSRTNDEMVQLMNEKLLKYIEKLKN